MWFVYVFTNTHQSQVEDFLGYRNAITATTTTPSFSKMEPFLLLEMTNELALHDLYLEIVISRREDINWPTRSPKLTPADFSYGSTLNVKFCSKESLKKSTLFQERCSNE